MESEESIVEKSAGTAPLAVEEPRQVKADATALSILEMGDLSETIITTGALEEDASLILEIAAEERKSAETDPEATLPLSAPTSPNSIEKISPPLESETHCKADVETDPEAIIVSATTTPADPTLVLSPPTIKGDDPAESGDLEAADVLAGAEISDRAEELLRVLSSSARKENDGATSALADAPTNDKVEELLVALGADPRQLADPAADTWLNSPPPNVPPEVLLEPEQETMLLSPQPLLAEQGSPEAFAATQTQLPSGENEAQIATHIRLPDSQKVNNTDYASPGVLRIPPSLAKRPDARTGGFSLKRQVTLMVCMLLIGALAATWLAGFTQERGKPVTAIATTPEETLANQSPPTKLPARTPVTRVTQLPTQQPTQEVSVELPVEEKNTPIVNVPTTVPVERGSVATPTAVPPTSPPVSLYEFSFEDGGTDGWASHQNISSVQNSTTVARDGSHSLKVTFNSSSNTDYPSLMVTGMSNAPSAGQTITANVYLAAGSDVRAKIFIQDQNLVWYDPGQTALNTLPIEGWFQLTFTIPADAVGPAARVGIQFYGYNATVYVDAVNW
jgi:hypothetical protein